MPPRLAYRRQGAGVALAEVGGGAALAAAPLPEGGEGRGVQAPHAHVFEAAHQSGGLAPLHPPHPKLVHIEPGHLWIYDTKIK